MGVPFIHVLPATIPTIEQATPLQLFGPLIAAMIALVGVFIGLGVNGRRERQRSLLTREDEYRREQRSAIAGVMVAAHPFRREAEAVALSGNGGRLVSHDLVRTQASIERAIDGLLSELSIARLVIHGKPLQSALDTLYKEWASTSACMRGILDSFSDDPFRLEMAATLDSSLDSFDKALGRLQEVALQELRPTIADEDG